MWSNIAPVGVKSLALKQQAGEPAQCKQEDRLSNRDSYQGSPLMRYKHAVCASPSTGSIYIHGGRFGNVALEDDIWCFDAHSNSWSQLQTCGPRPPALQEHTIVEQEGDLYLFGGQVSASPLEPAPFWRLHLAQNEWHALGHPAELGAGRAPKLAGAHLGPTNRRGHSAVVYQNSMYIFGGYEDFRGSSGQLWQYDFADERWQLRNLSSSSACQPEPRHSHSAIVHEHSMFVYGGLSNLKPLGDLWRWSWLDRRWYRERTRGKTPGQLHGHTAVQAFGSMFVFGGERNGRPSRALWRLNLADMSWKKLRTKGPRPAPTTWHGAIANPLGLLDEANYLIESSEAGLLSACASVSASASVSAHRNSVSASALVELAGHSSASPAREAPDSEGVVEAEAMSPPIGRRPMDGCSMGEQQQQQQAGKVHSARLEQRNTPSERAEQKPQLVLDSLDSDIKRMFAERLGEAEAEELDEPLEERAHGLMPMDTSFEQASCDATMDHQLHMQTTSSTTLDYATASQMHSLASCSFADQAAAALARASQRTSYAYATPPSHGSPTPTPMLAAGAGRHAWNEPLVGRRPPLVSSRANAGAGAGAGVGGAVRAGRPKSEIVQSLIDRADAHIKQVYTPFFNGAAGRRERALARRNSLLADKSKRHTIHQTMTFYNLYFAEGAGARRPQASSSSSTPDENRNMRRDELSSSTIRELSSATSGGAALVGVHGLESVAGSGISRTNTGSRTSSDSRTLGTDTTLTGTTPSVTISSVTTTTGSISSEGTLLDGPPTNSAAAAAAAALREGLGREPPVACRNFVDPSLPSASLGPRDQEIKRTQEQARDECQYGDVDQESNEPGDNTSLSFSVIAEFEEDDMLHVFSSPAKVNPARPRFSQPAEPSAMETDEVRSRPLSTPNQRLAMGGHTRGAASPVSHPELDMELELSNEPQTPARTSEDQKCGPAAEDQHCDDEHVNPAHKSASSGYDSISFEHSRLPHDKRVARHSTRQAAFGANESENGSVRAESSLNGTSAGTTTETSPEQSAGRRRKRLFTLYRQQQPTAKATHDSSNNQTSVSSATADSLAFTSVDSSSFGKSVPSSPPASILSPISSEISRRQVKHQESIKQISSSSHQTHRKFPFVSRSRSLFGSKRKAKNRYWQLCMFVIGGKQAGQQTTNDPISMWRLYI